MKKISGLLILVCLLIGIFFSVNFVFAAKTLGDSDTALKTVVTKTALVKDVNNDDVFTRAGQIVNVALTTIGMVFFIFVVYAGFKWLTSEGNDEKVKKAKSTLISASVGLLVILGSYAITNTLLSGLITTKTSTGPSEFNPTLGVEDTTKAIGCCIDRVGEKLWTARVTSRGLCESLQGNDGYAGPEDQYWFFSTIANTSERCQDEYNRVEKECYKNVNLLFGGYSGDEMAKCFQASLWNADVPRP